MSAEFAPAAAPRCCLIIPVYRHLKPLVGVLSRLDAYPLPCFLVDDWNDPPLKDALSAELSRRSWVDVIRLPNHGGKGIASVAGCRQARQRGFTHAIFMDADDQHDVADIPRMLAMARENPRAMILGRPVFDASAPPQRRIGRIVSNLWVWIETLSFDIQDSLCGFHCLPLEPLVKIAGEVHLGKRMDFDPEILVRLFWEGVPVVTFDTRVRYPSDGLSNFSMVRDNAALFWLHTRLFFGMLLRSPALVQSRWRRA